MQSQQHIDELILKAQQGDEHALAELFENHRDRLGRMVKLRMDRRIMARVAVSDVLQDAFVDLANQLGNYTKDPKLPFFLWLRIITGQRLAKTHRAHLGQEKRDVAREFRLDHSGIPEASAVFMANQLVGQFTSVSVQAVRNENQQRIQDAIEKMEEQEREILALRHVEQLNNVESAHVLELSEKAASKRYMRAIRKLRDAVGANK